MGNKSAAECPERGPRPFGLSPKNAMSLYDSRQRTLKYTMAKPSQTCTTLHSQSLIVTPFDNNKLSSSSTNDSLSVSHSVVTSKSEVSPSTPAVSGGYESNEIYTYVRDRGRYVWNPLQKAIDVEEAYTCHLCLFRVVKYHEVTEDSIADDDSWSSESPPPGVRSEKYYSLEDKLRISNVDNEDDVSATENVFFVSR